MSSPPLPNRSVRIAPEHNDVLNTFLSLLRAGRADEVRAILSVLQASKPNHQTGPFGSEDAAPEVLLGRVVAAGHPRAIWLFGSRARGNHHPRSDFDFLAVFPDDDPDVEGRRSKMAEAVAALGVGVDVVACTTGEFESCRDTVGSLIRVVHQEGREVYASPAERRHRRRAV